MKWISVKDKVPHDDFMCAFDWVLVRAERDDMYLTGMAQYLNGTWDIFEDVGFHSCTGFYAMSASDITHWMPIPSLDQEEEEHDLHMSPGEMMRTLENISGVSDDLKGPSYESSKQETDYLDETKPITPPPFPKDLLKDLFDEECPKFKGVELPKGGDPLGLNKAKRTIAAITRYDLINKTKNSK